VSKKAETIQDKPAGDLADDVLPIIKRVQKEGEEDKGEFYNSLERVYYWWTGAKDEIYDGREDDSEIEGDSTSSEQAVRHYPLLWSYVEVMKAILMDEIKPYYVGKFRSGRGHMGELGNAVFEALRLPMKWDDAISDSIENMIMFYQGVIGPYVNYNKYWPDTVPGIRTFNPWFFHQTRGCTFDEAPERLLLARAEKSELIQMYPHYASQIEKLTSWDQSKEESVRENKGDNRMSAWHNLPGPYGKKRKRFSENAIKLSELWYRDTTRRRINRDDNIKKAQDENDLLIEFLSNPQGDIPDSTMWFADEDFHDDHIAVHEAWVAMQDNSAWMRFYPEIANQVVEEMKLHIEEHKRKKAIFPTERQGYVFEYARGWRYSLVANEELMLEDGESPWLDEFDIVGPPLTSFSMLKDPVEVHGEPWAQRFVDLNATYSSFMNFMEDIFESRGDKLVVDESGLEGGIAQVTNHPREPIRVKSNRDIGEVIKSLGGAKPPPELFHYMTEVRGVLEQAAGVHDPILGKPGSNVRSAEQLRSLVSQNQVILNYHLKRIVPAIKELCIMTWQVAVGLGLDKDYLDTQVNGILVDFELDELEELEDAPFTVNVKIRSSGLTTLEEKARVVENVTPRFLELYGHVPGSNDVIAEEIAEIYSEDVPGLKAMQKRLAALQAQFLQQQQQEQEAAALAAEVGGAEGLTMPNQPDLQVLP
jgi:hypothetical protein